MLKITVVCALVATAAATYGAPDAVVGIVPGSNEKISGTIYLSTQHYGVLITGTVKGLSPGLHGFHVHENGDTSQKCVAAGGHFNPQKRSHGAPGDIERHAGDLGNILADKNGIAHITIIDTHISLDPNSPNNVGKLSFVIHAGEDDLGKGGNDESLKTGNAGARDGCGIIHVVERPTYPHQSSYYHAAGPTDSYGHHYYYK